MIPIPGTASSFFQQINRIQRPIFRYRIIGNNTFFLESTEYDNLLSLAYNNKKLGHSMTYISQNTEYLKGTNEDSFCVTH